MSEATRDAPNRHGCVHTRITVECSQMGCTSVAVLTFHAPKGTTAPVGCEFPHGWAFVPESATVFSPVCPTHREMALRSVELLVEFQERVEQTMRDEP